MKINNTKILKKNNQFLVLNEIIDNQPISRAELTGKLNVSHTTIFTIVKELMDQGLVVETGYSESSGGRRSKLLSFNGKHKYVIGVEIEEKEVLYAIYDLNFDLIMKDIFSVKGLELDGLIDKLDQKIRAAVTDLDLEYNKIIGMGVSIPGIYKEENDEVIDATNKIIEAKGIRKKFRRKFMIPVYLENDANLAAYYEWSYGQAQGFNNIIYIYLGEGIGGGIVINNSLYRGGHGNAGEIGHIKVKASGKKCACGGVGCLESIASITAIEDQFNERIEKGEDSLLVDIKKGPYSFTDIFTIAQRNDYLAINVLEEAYKYLVIGISSLVNIFDPDLIFLGGSFNKFNNELYIHLKEELGEISFKNIVNELEIRTSSHDNLYQRLAASLLAFDKWKRRI